jgi:hypothetical protein
MPVAFVFESDGLDQAQYDAFVKMTGYDNLGAALPPGGIAHLAGPRSEGGWRVVDLWESEEAANAYYGSDQFRPVREGGVDMKITPWPMHLVKIDQAIKHLG